MPIPALLSKRIPEDVRRQLSRCKLGKALGPGGIQARVLRDCAMEISPVLYSIFSDFLRPATVQYSTSLDRDLEHRVAGEASAPGSMARIVLPRSCENTLS
ncbi:hypothetical protein SKAU_G00190510 [Synaphobranchus kaupii]|uniref:Uncharacterized protein n=1 Tax=Synaphobranchus kaupii TaxID=118154 RepID=A0A9Q1IV56_SYNKA|nr:hypothetical protein SKAU_G00190510 [Synaphobranchus kaupii]